MMFNLLADTTTENSGTQSGWGNWGSIILIAVLVVVMVVVMILMSRRSKKQRQEAEDLINAVKPGNKVKTIGGVCGIVVEVDEEENTFVLETGSETSGKCYMKFDRQAILQSDAVVDKTSSKPVAAEEPFEEPSAAESDKQDSEEQPAQTQEDNSGKAE